MVVPAAKFAFDEPVAAHTILDPKPVPGQGFRLVSSGGRHQPRGRPGGAVTFVSSNPGRDVQRVGTARFLGQDPGKIHDPVWAVTGNLGDSQCYLGVTQKVEAIQTALSARILRDDLPVRLIPPAYTLGVSDGQLNGTDQMRFSLI